MKRTELDDFEQAILDSLEDVDIMRVNDLLLEGWDFYDALEYLGLL